MEVKVEGWLLMEIQLWREILEPYALAIDELVVKFNHIIDSYRKSGNYSPIEQVNGRVKSISSILEKCQKKKIDFKNFEEEIEDIAGVRIICQFGIWYFYQHRYIISSCFHRYCTARNGISTFCCWKIPFFF